MIAGNLLFSNGVLFSGTWCFNGAREAGRDLVEIVGTAGKISFSVFSEDSITVTANGRTNVLSFDPLQHVQQPMIEATVRHFLGDGPNPCSGREGAEVMRLINEIAG
jgi:hypothetical protein